MDQSKGKLYSTLAGVSLLLLMAFLAYWNYDSYQRSKDELRQDLTDQMQLSVADYQDSIIQNILTTVVVDSLAADSGELDISIELTEGSVTHSFTQSSHNVSGPMPEAATPPDSTDSPLTVVYDAELDRKIVVWNSDVGSREVSVTIDSSKLESIDLDDLMTRDTFFFQKDSLISLHDSLDLPPLYNTIDAIFSDRLAEANLLLSHAISTADQAKDHSDRDMAIPFNYGLLQGARRPHAVFKGYQSYLLKGMLPNLIISLLLLSAIAATFFIILRNWKSQLRLAAVKDEFISNMTHELKTPISTVGVALEALGNYGVIDDPNKREEYLDISKHELERLNILVDKVLKMSTLDQDLDPSNFIEVDLDKVHLINVLYNIIDNAIKYAGSAPEVSIDLSANQQGIALSFSDNGPGIPAAYISKIFDRLFRVPTAGKHNVKGHEGNGTTFIIQLPRHHD